MSHGYLKCKCEHCDNPIEYPVESAGETVLCPHCHLPTPLTVPVPEGGDDAVVVGGKMGKFVIIALIVLVIAAIGAAAAVDYAKHLKKKKFGGPPTPSAEASASAQNVAVEAVGGDWQKIKPVVGRFQGGYTAAQIKEGRYILGGSCTECHKMYDPVIFPRSQWDEIARSMRGKAKLREHEFEDMQVFVQSIR
jgi:cytochrome c5